MTETTLPLIELLQKQDDGDARAPEGDGCAERFIRTLKENLLWVRVFLTFSPASGPLRAGIFRPKSLSEKALRKVE